MSLGNDAVVGVFARERLTEGLVATHRAGFGPHARVLDGSRGELAGQVRRMGLVVPLSPEEDAGSALIVVTAPGRTNAVADILTRAGALAVHVVGRASTPQASDAAVSPASARLAVPPSEPEDEAPV